MHFEFNRRSLTAMLGALALGAALWTAVAFYESDQKIGDSQPISNHASEQVIRGPTTVQTHDKIGNPIQAGTDSTRGQGAIPSALNADASLDSQGERRTESGGKSEVSRKVASQSSEEDVPDRNELATTAMLIRDCAGQNIPNCSDLETIALRVERAPDRADDGWSEWMEEQIRVSIATVAKQNNFIAYDVKCSAEECVFFVAAETGATIFGDGFRYHNSFDDWLRRRPWTDELQPMSKRNGDRSPLAWRIVGSDPKPFINWYVVKRRP